MLEAHVVTALTREIDHLILIGDHKQLRPRNAAYRLATDYNLDVSLFERLIQNGIECHQLKEQYRMRPEISSLLKPQIYENLLDHRSVYEYENVDGESIHIYRIRWLSLFSIVFHRCV